MKKQQDFLSTADDDGDRIRVKMSTIDTSCVLFNGHARISRDEAAALVVWLTSWEADQPEVLPEDQFRCNQTPTDTLHIERDDDGSIIIYCNERDHEVCICLDSDDVDKLITLLRNRTTE